MTAPSRFFHHLRRAALAAVGAAFACAAAAQWAPNESQVSQNRGLIDLEFSQTRAKFAWTDSRGDMWLAGVNRDTGDFEPGTGRGLLIAKNTVSGLNMFLWNGPEWLSMASGEQIYYSYYLPDKPPIARNVRQALAIQDATGAWVTQPLGPAKAARMSHIASSNRGDPNPTIKYLDPNLNQYWRNALDASSEELMPFIPPSNKSWRFASGLRALLYTQEVNGIPQVFAYMLDSKVNEQLTFDDGAKDTDRTVPWMWQAPEFGDDFVLSTVVNQSELRIYRRFPMAGGVLQWQPIYSASLPAGTAAGSPQWFTYNNKSYVYMVGYVAPNEFPSEVWVSNINAAAPLFRRITDDTLLRVRNDPEHFITSSGPLIYYNRYNQTLDPDHPLCADCSEGVFRANPGLGGL